MTEFDEEFLPIADELIDEYGASIQFGQLGPGVYDPASGRNMPTGALGEAKAIIGTGRARTRSGGLVEGAQLTLYMAGAKLPGGVKPESHATVNGVLYKVLHSEGTYSGQEVALYTIWVGK